MTTIGFHGAMERARQWLLEALTGGERLREEVIKAGLSQGYNQSNLELAARQLHVISERVKIPARGWRAKWRLPDANEKLEVREAMPNDDVPQNLTEQLTRLQQMQQSVDVYRFTDGEPGFLDSIQASDCTLRGIKRRFGGGRYSVEGLTFVIEGSPLSAEGEALSLRPRGSTVRDTPGQAPQSVIDPAVLMLKMFDQQAALLTAIIASKNTGPDPVAMFKALDDAVARRTPAAAAGPATPVDQALALLKEGMALGRSSAEGEDPDERGWARTVGAIGPFLNALAAKMTTQPAAPSNPVPALPAASEPDPTATHEASLPVNALARVLQDLGPAVPQLLAECKKGTKPELVAEYIEENATDEQYDALAEAAESPQFVTEVMEALVQRTTNAGWAVEWMRHVVTALYELLQDRGDDAGAAAHGDAERANGDQARPGRPSAPHTGRRS